MLPNIVLLVQCLLHNFYKKNEKNLIIRRLTTDFSRIFSKIWQKIAKRNN